MTERYRETMECTEVVIFRVAEQDFPAFCAAREQLISETKARTPGLLTTTLLRHTTSPEIYSDFWVWENTASAKAGYMAFSSLPSAPNVLKYVREKIYSGHFEVVPGPSIFP